MHDKRERQQLGESSRKASQLSFFNMLEETELAKVDLKMDENMKDERQKLDQDTNTIYPIQFVHDFDIFLKYITDNQVQLTKKKGNISRVHLPNLNDQLSIRNDKAPRNTEQGYYPYIHLFHSLALYGNLVKKNLLKGGKQQLQITERLTSYKKLSDVEKYFFMLETFWIDVDWNDFQEESYTGVPETLQYLFLTFMNKNSHKKDDLSMNDLRNWNHFLLFFEWFGLWKCETDQDKIDKYYRKNWYFAKHLYVTEFGMKMIPILLMERNLQFWNVPLRWELGEVNAVPGSNLESYLFYLPEEIEARFPQEMDQHHVGGFLQPFKKLFPKEVPQRSLPRQSKNVKDKQYHVKVSLTKDIWRTLMIRGTNTFEDLHEMIIEAYDFDDDHLYSFFMDGKKWSQKSIVSPLDDFGNPQADKVRMSELGLILGQSFMYLYDYGDEWTFNIIVEAIIDGDASPYVMDSKGTAPDQYVDW